MIPLLKMSSARIATVLLMLCSFADTVHTLVQDDINDMASNIQVRYDVVDNLIDSWLKYKARVTLQNKGSRSLKQGPWALYFCSIRIVEPDHLPNNPHGYIIPGGPGIKLTHINGCLHKMEPTTDFKDLAPDSSVKIEFKVKYFAVAKTDIMPNWYFGAEGLVSKAVKNTQGEGLDFVGEFTTEHQWRRYTGDNYHPLSPGERFDRIEASDLGKAPLLLIPTPLKISGWEKGNRMKVSNDKWKITADKGLENEASFLAVKIRATTVTSSPPLTKVIKMELKDPDVIIGGSKTTNQEAYSLVVDVSGQTITIHGNTTAAVFYGIQSLLAIIDDKGTVPKVTVKDAPRYAYRGMHLDVGRNFKTKDKVLQFLDMLATYKFNKFHFHLCEDEGWRLQIKGLEELTEVGSKRCHDLNETTSRSVNCAGIWSDGRYGKAISFPMYWYVPLSFWY
ncbi:Chitobiase [Exaiptasia diaphana]|nr:Chitobiase [Exaiptasia diaphana]